MIRQEYPQLDYRTLDEFTPQKVLVFGGDGTILRVARYIGDARLFTVRVPNSRGFLSEVDGSSGWNNVKNYIAKFLAEEKGF